MTEDGRILFNRPPRIGRTLPKGKIDIPNPPESQFKGSRLEWALLIGPIVLSFLTLTSVSLISVLRPNGNAIYLLSTGVMSIGFVITGTLNVVQRIITDRNNRKEFSDILNIREEKLRDYDRQQQTILHYLYPSLPQLLDWVQTPGVRLWERRPADPDFLSLRIGVGARPNAVEINHPNTDKTSPLAERAQRIADAFSEVHNVPDIIELNQIAYASLVGETEDTRRCLRALICHMAAHHSPNDVKILATYPPEQAEEWEWVGWLPHCRISDTAGNEVPLVASHSDQLQMISNFVLQTLKRRENQKATLGSNGMLGPEKGPRKAGYQFPNLVWVVEDYALVQDEPAVKKLFEVGAELGVFIITTSETLTEVPDRSLALLEVLPNKQIRYAISGPGGRVTTLQPDVADLDYCDAFAAALSPLMLKVNSERGDIPSSLRLLDILGVDGDRGELFDPLSLWNRSSVGTLKVPVGRVFGGAELYLDLSDKGHGPHGLIAGTTGSGKSELLLTVVSSLALANHPDNLNFILGDFKGGATFNPFIGLPHVVGMMSDLDLTIVERAMTAIYSELKRRERLLKDEGVTHIRDYQKKKPKPKQPMPYLIVIIDEFAEMKEQAPDFMDKVINIARTGRTLGVHMILATQRPAGVVTGQLNSNTKFRLCLRVETAEDSTDMLGRKDAYLIPSAMPGRAFFKVGSDIFEQFQVARVAVPFGPPKDGAVQENIPVLSMVDADWRMSPLLPHLSPKRTTTVNDEGEEVPFYDHDAVTQQCIAAAKRTVIRNTHKPWLDPMGGQYFLPDHMESGGFDAKTLTWPTEPPYGWGRAPLAYLDDVVDQKQEPMIMDLPEQGSYGISGLAVSGKTMLVRTMLTTLAMTHAPDLMEFYILDMGNTLKPFARLPHKTVYVSMAEQSKMRTVVKNIFEEMQRRKTIFAGRGVLELAAYRALEDAAPLPPVFVAFDNFDSIRHNPPYDTEQLKALVREGRPFGIHVAITLSKATDFEYGRMIDQFYQIAMRQTREDIVFPVPKNMVGSWNGVPGRAFIKGPHNRPPIEIQGFLPCIGEVEAQVKAIEDLIGRMRQAAALNRKWAALNPDTPAAVQPAPAPKAAAPAPVQPQKAVSQEKAAPPPPAPVQPQKAVPQEKVAPAPAAQAPVKNRDAEGAVAAAEDAVAAQGGSVSESDAAKIRSESVQSYWANLFKVPQADVDEAAQYMTLPEDAVPITPASAPVTQPSVNAAEVAQGAVEAANAAVAAQGLELTADEEKKVRSDSVQSYWANLFAVPQADVDEAAQYMVLPPDAVPIEGAAVAQEPATTPDAVVPDEDIHTALELADAAVDAHGDGLTLDEEKQLRSDAVQNYWADLFAVSQADIDEAAQHMALPDDAVPITPQTDAAEPAIGHAATDAGGVMDTGTAAPESAPLPPPPTKKFRI